MINNPNKDDFGEIRELNKANNASEPRMKCDGPLLFKKSDQDEDKAARLVDLSPSSVSFTTTAYLEKGEKIWVHFRPKFGITPLTLRFVVLWFDRQNNDEQGQSNFSQYIVSGRFVDITSEEQELLNSVIYNSKNDWIREDIKPIGAEVHSSSFRNADNLPEIEDIENGIDISIGDRSYVDRDYGYARKSNRPSRSVRSMQIEQSEPLMPLVEPMYSAGSAFANERAHNKERFVLTDEGPNRNITNDEASIWQSKNGILGHLTFKKLGFGKKGGLVTGKTGLTAAAVLISILLCGLYFYSKGSNNQNTLAINNNATQFGNLDYGKQGKVSANGLLDELDFNSNSDSSIKENPNAKDNSLGSLGSLDSSYAKTGTQKDIEPIAIDEDKKDSAKIHGDFFDKTMVVNSSPRAKAALVAKAPVIKDPVVKAPVVKAPTASNTNISNNSYNTNNTNNTRAVASQWNKATPWLPTRNKEGNVEITLLTDKPAYSHNAFWLENPKRFVVDVPGRLSGFEAKEYRMKTKLANKLRIGRHPDKVRFVIEVSDFIEEASVEENGDFLVLNLK